MERGLELFGQGDAEAALALFLRAQQLGPTADEARAACCECAGSWGSQLPMLAVEKLQPDLHIGCCCSWIQPPSPSAATA